MQAVAVPDRIDAGNAVDVLASLAQAVAALDAAGAAEPPALDLAPLREFDSSALSLLLELGRSRRDQRGGRPAQPLFLLNPPPKLQELAELYGVDGLLFGAPEPPN